MKRALQASVLSILLAGATQLPAREPDDPRADEEASTRRDPPGGQDERARPEVVIRPGPDEDWDSVRIRLWTDREEGAAYCPGESLRMHFRTDADAYVTIYDLDTRGRVRVLFPNRYHTRNWVRGGRTYTLPSRDYHFRIAGPAGTEILRAVASPDRRDELRYGGRPRLWSRDWDSSRHRVSKEEFDRVVTGSRRPARDEEPRPSRHREDDSRWIAPPVAMNIDEVLIEIEDGWRCEEPRFRRYGGDRRPDDDERGRWRDDEEEK